MKFSVIIPTYNRRHLIGQAITSALEQLEVEVEVIVVDDGSTDGTVNWLTEEFATQPVLVLSNTRQKGPSGARNMGILAASGDFVALLDSDDYFLPHHLSECQNVFVDIPEVDVVVGQSLYKKNGQIIDSGDPILDRKRELAPIKKIVEEVTVFSNDFFFPFIGIWLLFCFIDSGAKS